MADANISELDTDRQTAVENVPAPRKDEFAEDGNNVESTKEGTGDNAIQAQRTLDELICKPDDEMTDADWKEFGGRTKCRLCNNENLTVVLLPCGCLSICVSCSSPLPQTCPVCKKKVAEPFRIYLRQISQDD